MTKENEKKKEKPNQRKMAFRQEAINELMDVDDENLVTPQKALEVAKLDCKQCKLHETSHNPKHQNCRDNPFCISRLGQEKFEKLINREMEVRDEAKKDQRRRDLNDQPAGLVNAGNFCYVNSFLQVWFNVPEFRQIVYDFRPSSTFVSPPAPRMDVQATMLVLQDIFFTLQTTPFNDTDKTSNLTGLLRLNNEQQDSQEFGLKFFNALERCLLDHPNGKPIMERMTKLFTGEIDHRLACKCGHSSSRMESSISLTLNIDGHTNLLSALDSYFQNEFISDYRCPTCGGTGVNKQCDYSKMPPILVIQLNRYKYTSKGRQKLKTPLAYPREIPAKLFQRTNQTNPPPAPMYDLFAVTIHDGNNADCGHYYDLIKNPYNQKWYHYNDATVEAIAKPPGYEKVSNVRIEKNKKKKEKEKVPAELRACYGLLYRRRDPHLPLPHPKLPPDELISESRNAVEDQFEGQTKQKIERSEKRLYDLRRRLDKLTGFYSKLETHIDKYKHPNEVAFLPLSLLYDVMASEYEVAKGEKKKKKEKAKEEEEVEEKKNDDEDADLAAAIAASEADQEKLKEASEPSTSTCEPNEIAEEETETSANDEADDQNTIEESISHISVDTTDSGDSHRDVLAIAMKELDGPMSPTTPEGSRKRTRTQNGTPKYVYSHHRSPRKSISGTNGSAPLKQPVSTRVAALLSAHDMPICGHGKMPIDSILFGDVKGVARAPAIALLREYDFRVKMVYENGQRIFPEPQRDREVFVFTAEDICMECVLEMRREGIFNSRLDDDEKLVRKILKEEKLRCSVKCPTKKPDNHFYVAKHALTNFKKSAQAVRENKLAQLHTKLGTMYFDSVTAQKEDPTYPAQVSLKRFRGRPRKSQAEVPEKIQRLDDSFVSDGANESILEDEEDVVEQEIPTTSKPSITEKPMESLVPLEYFEFNSELRCNHDGVNFSQFRHAVSPEEWNTLKQYFDNCFEVKCSEEVCGECRRQEEDAQHGSDNMRILIREMKKRIGDIVKTVDSRREISDDENIKYGICSVFLANLKKMTGRQSNPSICQDCLICKHQKPCRGFYSEDNPKETHIVGLTESEWNTFVNEIRNLEHAGDPQNVFVEPRQILISKGSITNLCDSCYGEHLKAAEDAKYTYEKSDIYVKLVNPADIEDTDQPKPMGKRRGRAKNVFSFSMNSSDKLLDLKMQLCNKTNQMPNDQQLLRELGGLVYDETMNQMTLFDLKILANNQENPLILMNQQFSPSSNHSDETGERVPERGFVDTALGH